MNMEQAQVAVLAENNYQELELWYPVLRLREAGANVLIVAPALDAVYGSKLGYPVRGDLAAEQVSAADFDAVIIPGGFAPEGLRRQPAVTRFVREMDERENLVAAICHAGWVLASAGIARGRRLTSVSLIRDDMINAGAHYSEERVVRDRNLITSQLPSDLPEFGKAIVDYLAHAPARRENPRRLSPAEGRPYSRAAYRHAARVVQGPRGRASANYVTYAVEDLTS